MTAGPVRGVMVEDALCPAVARILRAGIRSEAANGWRPPTDVRELVDVITSVARDQAMSAAGPVQAVNAGESPTGPDMPAGLTRPSLDRVVGVAEAAGLLHMTSRHVRRLAASGRLTATQAPGGAWLIDRRSIDGYGR